jgi:hypothetical protein
MKARLLLPVLLACAAHARAQVFPPAERGAYLSGQLGNGRIHGGNATGERNMQWLAFEARGGRDLNPAIVGETSINAPSRTRLDFVYYNEGHPENNHRDGFAVQLTYSRTFGNGLTAEVAAGPYTSMNTTTLKGVEFDQARTGILFTAALLYPLEQWGRGTHLRLGYNHVWKDDVHESDALMLGIGRHFTSAPPYPGSAPGQDQFWLGAAIGRSITNLSGGAGATNGMLEARQYFGKWAGSLKLIYEGDDGKYVDRKGAALQLWFVQPLTPHWTFGAALGPYFADNRRNDEEDTTQALFTFEIERRLSKRTKAFFAFNRVKTFLHTNDRDLYQLGVLTAFP